MSPPGPGEGGARPVESQAASIAPADLRTLLEGGAKGLRVVDVWDTAEQFQQFVETRLMPGVAQIGIPGEPAVEVLPIHRLFTPGYTPK